MRTILKSCLLVAGFFTIAASADPLPESEVPVPLKPWIGWVLHGHEDRGCPQPAEDGGERPCAWPSRLQLDLADNGGRFQLDAHTFAQSWIELPGEGPAWPQDASVDGRPTPVIEHNGDPALRVDAGTHRIQGRFDWSHMPESLRVPPATGVIVLKVNGALRGTPQRDSRSHVWFGRAKAAATTDTVQIRAFRLIDDGIPMQVTTHLEIAASGNVRDETIGPLLPSGFKPLRIDGTLPARLDDDGKLHLQLRPGVWTLDVVARATAPISDVGRPQATAPWPEQEIWSFQAHPDLRIVEVAGAPAIDPQQAQVPEAWRNLPAYAITDDAVLKFAEKQRGLPQTAPDQITLSRRIWLDFDGDGYTIQDRMSGRLTNGWRLQTLLPLTLGRAVVDGQPQLITRNDDGGGSGVEVRRGTLQLAADSRIDADTRQLPTGGWNKDLQAVHATLYLPPAWRLLAVPGADNVPDTWLSRWTLLDLFVVLIASIAAFRLFGVGTGLLTLLTFALIWHEPAAPRWSWINLIAAIAVVRVLPASFSGGALQRWVLRYQWLSAAAIVLIAIPFAISHARWALYPQLEPSMQPGQMVAPSIPFAMNTANDELKEEAAAEEQVSGDLANAPAPTMAAPTAMRAEVARPMAKMAISAGGSLASFTAPAPAAQQPIQRLDPNALTQTGPGLPQWNWRSVMLTWSGPVTPAQTFRLWLQPPSVTRALDILVIVLIAALLARWTNLHKLRGPGLLRELRGASTATALMAVAAIALGAALGYAPRANAQDNPGIQPQQIPPVAPGVLDELRDRLLAPPDCAPECAQLPRLLISIGADGERLLLRLTADAQAQAAIPLPVPLLAADDQNRAWQPDSVLLDGHTADVRRADSGELLAVVPAGRHELTLSGSLAGLGQVQLPLPLKPRHVSAAITGWLLTGASDDGEPADALQLLKETPASATVEAAAGTQQILPPLLTITRTLHLGLDWTTDTDAQRFGGAQNAIVVSIPLLDGEALTGEAVRVVDGAAQVSFVPGQTSAHWTSRLPVKPKLKLVAPASADAFEIWRFDISPLWRADISGLAPVSHTTADVWLPTYQPWPGESVQLSVTRPTGADGQTLTLQQAELAVRPGARATDYTLNLRISASRGGQHSIKLPDGFDITGLTIDGATQPVHRSGSAVVLPLHPGEQQTTLTLRGVDGMRTRIVTPAIDVGGHGVNARIEITLPPDRWILLAGGPQLGPAVLFWGVLAVLFAVGTALGRVKLTPLRGYQWALLFVGLSQIEIPAAAVVVVWLFALGARGRSVGTNVGRWRFNAMQIVLLLLTASALGLLFSAVAHGLLGAPDMQIAGNGSYRSMLRWYQDRFGPQLPQAWVLSVSIWVYRGLMLLWALWLANALLGWLRWGWEQFAAGVLWRRRQHVDVPSVGGA